MNSHERIQDRLNTARASLEEAKSLLDAGMDLGFVMNSLYYAVLYSVYALLESKGIEIATQSVSIARFDEEFIKPGVFDKGLSEALHRAFEFRRSCACETPKDLSRRDAEALLPGVESFLKAVEVHFAAQ